MVRLETERLIIRKPGSQDAEDVIKPIGDPEVAKYLANIPYPYKKKHFEEYVNKDRGKRDFAFFIELKSDKRVIGGIGLHRVDKDVSKASVGYWVNKEYWGQGYASEALNAVLDFAFNKLKLNRVEAYTREGNDKSGHILEKFGGKHEGTRRQATFDVLNKKPANQEMYGILKSEFKPLKKKK